MSKAAVRAIRFFEGLADTGIRGKLTAKFFSGLLKMIHPRAKVIDDNLKIAYPDSNPEWRNEIRRKVYENLAWTLTETLALQKDPSQAQQWVKNVHGHEIFSGLMQRGQGAIFLTGHFGNWELLGAWTAQQELQHGRKLHVIYQDLHDKDISQYIHDMREKCGMLMTPKDISVLKLAHMLKSGEHVAVLNDVAGTGKCIAPFMGHDATNMPGTAVMALLSGVPVIPACIYRKAPFEHEAEFFPPVEMPPENLNREERIRLAVIECNRAYENFIRKRPEFWFWLHKRWRP